MERREPHVEGNHHHDQLFSAQNPHEHHSTGFPMLAIELRILRLCSFFWIPFGVCVCLYKLLGDHLHFTRIRYLAPIIKIWQHHLSG